MNGSCEFREILNGLRINKLPYSFRHVTLSNEPIKRQRQRKIDMLL